MPQCRRKVPFGGKKKKQQLMAKRQSKAAKSIDSSDSSEEEENMTKNITERTNYKTNVKSDKMSTSKRYVLKFHKESKEMLRLMREKAQMPFSYVLPSEREIDDKYFKDCDFPLRPEWNYGMTKEQLDANERRYFTEYIKSREDQLQSESLSIFELNLETWRQLWRVLEISDIILTVVDVRYAAFLFPPFLYEYVTKKLNKKMILILNKVDLVPAEVTIAWSNYFTNTYDNMSVVTFASYSKRKGQKKNILFQCSINVLKSCKKIVGSDIDLTKWEQKIMNELSSSEKDDILKDDCATHVENYSCDFEKHVKYKNNVLTLGFIGFPNVGKSSVLNAIKGHKVVSVSKNPGCTKHFQTIFITENVKLCDCPGLVFPSRVPKYVQALIGSYPIAQLQEPYQSIQYVGERIKLQEILKLNLPESFSEWSGMAVCEAWAIKNHFFSKKERPDLYRAANNLLRMILNGQIILEFYPPKYFENYDHWLQHPDLEELKKFLSDNFSQQQDENTHVQNDEDNSDTNDETSQSGEYDTDSADDANPFNILNKD